LASARSLNGTAHTARTETNTSTVFATVRANGGGGEANRSEQEKGDAPRRGAPPAVRDVRPPSAGPVSCDEQGGGANKPNRANSETCSPSTLAEKTLGRVGGPPHVELRANIDGAGGIMLEVLSNPDALRQILGARCDDDGPTPAAFAWQATSDLVQVALSGQKLEPGPAPMRPVNAMLQAVAAFTPADEVEGMIALQAVALHHVTMDALARAGRCERPDLRSLNLSQANKCSRTFAALVETLNRHRGKVTTQKVIVENVTVEAGGQAVVGAVAGVGSSKNGAIQSHADTEGSSRGAGAGARRPALLGADTTRDAMPAGSSEREETMPDARRRRRNRSAEGQQEPPGARTLHRRGNRGAANDPGAAAERSGTHLTGAVRGGQT
jgi:hypothetical protein